MRGDQIQREIEYALVSTDNLERFAEMFELCFGQRVGTRYFDWKYKENPAGEIIAFEALHKGKPVAFYGVIPDSFEVNGQPALIYQSMDTMTHPSYQRRGLFGKLAKMTYDHIINQDNKLNMIGIPGLLSYPGFVKKLEWKNIHEFATIVLPRQLHQMLRIKNPRANVKCKSVSEMTPELVTFLQKKKTQRRPIRNVLTPSFFNWRVFKSPLRNYNVVQVHDGDDLVGVIVYTLEKPDRVKIFHLEFTSEELYLSHASSVITFLFKESGANFMMTWKPNTELLERAYRKLGFVYNPFKIGPLSMRQPLIVKSDTGTIDNVDLYDHRNYDLQPIMQD